MRAVGCAGKGVRAVGCHEQGCTCSGEQEEHVPGDQCSEQECHASLWACQVWSDAVMQPGSRWARALAPISQRG